MSSSLSLAALGLSIVGLGVASYALTRSPASPEHSEARVAALESEVALLTDEIGRLRARGPTLQGAMSVDSMLPDTTSARVAGSSSVVNADASESAEVVAAREAKLEKLVEATVERKAEAVLEDMRIKGNKKPPIEVLSKALELSAQQQAATSDEVVRGQREAYDLLETLTDDGTNLMDELVSIVAKGIAKPGTDAGWGAFIGRLTSERIPGRDETYVAAIEGVKANMRQRFTRIWNEEQVEEFRAWGADPLEIGDIPGSPRTALQERIRTRARDLGANIPDNR